MISCFAAIPGPALSAAISAINATLGHDARMDGRAISMLTKAHIVRGIYFLLERRYNCKRNCMYVARADGRAKDRKSRVGRFQLLVQPGAGVQPLIKGVQSAKKSVEIAIFRFDQPELERALAEAVARGVSVKALIASRNRAGEANLRRLELRLLEAGVTVARTDVDLARYHAKLLIIDRKTLYLLAFNLTRADIEGSRSFGLVTSGRKEVREVAKVFEADMKRTRYEPELEHVVVSPLNARASLAKFIKHTKKQLIIYDPCVSDREMLRLLADRAKAGVEIRMIGTLEGDVPGMTARRLPHLRLHTRTMVRDGTHAFIGSQSMRAMELDSRREVGLIFRDTKAVAQLLRTFESDWSQTESQVQGDDSPVTHAVRIAKKVAKAVVKEMPDVSTLINGAVEQVVGETGDSDIANQAVEEMVKGAVKAAVKEVVQDAIAKTVEQDEAISK